MNRKKIKQVVSGIIIFAVVGVGFFLSSRLAFGQPLDSEILLPPIIEQSTPDPIPSLTDVALAYISENYGISLEQITVWEQYQQDYVYLEKSYWHVTALDTIEDKVYRVQVNTADQSVTEDLYSIEQADQEAKLNKFGKFEPALYDRLESMNVDEKIEIAIWIAGETERSQEDLYISLATKYPQAQEAIEKSGNPFDVGDYDLSMEIKREYLHLVEEENSELISPAIEHLKELGYDVIAGEGIPTVFVTLPKSVILEIADEPWVGSIALADQQEEPQMDTVVPSDRVPLVWAYGIDGSWVDIAILEKGKIDFNYMDQGQVRSCSLGEYAHKTRVASVAGSNHPTYSGIAKDAEIHDACESGSVNDTINALSWASNYAMIINYSAALGDSTTGLDYSDRAFDHYARYNNVFIAVASGNDGDYVTSPGYGWNVMTVGAADHQITSDWSDDEWRSSSRWKNYSTSGVEKPEVVAPGQEINMIGLNGNLNEKSGTSYAAPQVAGLAALMIDRDNDNLFAWPNAIKAAIMASAVNNIDGPSIIDSSSDLKDGAGAIDAVLADQIASRYWTSESSSNPCPGPCWWGKNYSNNSFPVGSNVYRYFNASKGERVRVVIAWWSKVNCPSSSNCSDTLGTNLDLRVFAPNGYIDSSMKSLSTKNNYEIVEFTAPQTGRYKIRIKKVSSTESASALNQLGIAWVSDATYLPYVVSNYGGWSSEIIVRNDGAEPKSIKINLFESDGDSKGIHTCGTLAHLELCHYTPTYSNFAGSAIVNAGEDVSVEVVHAKSSDLDSNNGMASGFGDPAFGQTGTHLYIPVVYRYKFGWDSYLYIMNTAASDADVTIYFYDRYSSSVDEQNPTISANERISVRPSTSNWVGSAEIISDQPLAVHVYDQRYDDGSHRTFNAATGGSSTLYAPAAYKAAWDLTTGFIVQNLGSSTTTANLYFYDRSGGNPHGPYPISNIAPMESQGVYLSQVSAVSNGWTGAVKIVSSNGQPLAVMVQTDNSITTGKRYSYNAASTPSNTVVLPYAVKDVNGRTSSYVVMNTSSASKDINIKYFDTNGNPTGSSSGYTYTLAGYGSKGVNLTVEPMSDGWQGYIVITTEEGINSLVAILRDDTSNAGSACNGVPR